MTYLLHATSLTFTLKEEKRSRANTFWKNVPMYFVCSNCYQCRENTFIKYHSLKYKPRYEGCVYSSETSPFAKIHQSPLA